MKAGRAAVSHIDGEVGLVVGQQGGADGGDQ